jgi:putative transcriptional regulator
MIQSKIFEALLEASRARRDARQRRLLRLLHGSITAPEVEPADEVDVRGTRALTGLSQARFAELLGLELSTLRNWEQGRRTPTGPARALLRAIQNDPVSVIKALSR